MMSKFPPFGLKLMKSKFAVNERSTTELLKQLVAEEEGKIVKLIHLDDRIQKYNKNLLSNHLIVISYRVSFSQ